MRQMSSLKVMDDAFYLFLQEHKVDRAGLPTARETGLRYHLMAGAGAGVERPGGLPWDSVPVRILRLPQERIDPQAKAAILAPLTALWLEESPDGCVEVCPLCEAVSGTQYALQLAASHLDGIGVGAHDLIVCNTSSSSSSSSSFSGSNSISAILAFHQWCFSHIYKK